MANRIYTKEETDYIKLNYGKLHYKDLALGINRSIHSVHKKIKRLSLSKGGNWKKYHRMMLNSIKPMKYKINDKKGWFVSGFVAGEGCFTKRSKISKGVEILTHSFSMEVADNDLNIMKEIKKIIGCGHLYPFPKRNERWKSTVMFVVQDRASIKQRVIPFFETYSLKGTAKHVQFEKWKESFLNHIKN